jgi:hypothetical protein
MSLRFYAFEMNSQPNHNIHTHRNLQGKERQKLLDGKVNLIRI